MLQVIYSGADGRELVSFKPNWQAVYNDRPHWCVCIQVALPQPVPA